MYHVGHFCDSGVADTYMLDGNTNTDEIKMRTRCGVWTAIRAIMYNGINYFLYLRKS